MKRNPLLEPAKALLPSDGPGRLLLCLAVVFVGSVYLFRATERDIYLEYNWLLAFMAILFCPVIVIVVFGIPGLLLSATLLYSRKPGASRVPLYFLIGGTVLVWFLPIPPMQERTLFMEHRADYERIVAFARAGQLGHEGWCRADIAFSPPAGYPELVAAGGCIFVYEHAVEIELPLHPYVVLTWSEMPGQPESDYCKWNGGIWDRIDAHWFICKRDYN